MEKVTGPAFFFVSLLFYGKQKVLVKQYWIEKNVIPC